MLLAAGFCDKAYRSERKNDQDDFSGDKALDRFHHGYAGFRGWLYKYSAFSVKIRNLLKSCWLIRITG
jgi:hypothetical protein